MVATTTLIEPTRRGFLAATGSAFAALVASGCSTRMAAGGAAAADGYGALVPDPAGLLDLPQGFSYRVVSSLGDAMDDGGTVPDAADGMGCFDLGQGKLALVRNHELRPGQGAGTTLTSGYGTMPDGTFMPGGTTTLVLDAAILKVEHQHRSLDGTVRNCARGVTPWGSWLTCEEPSSLLTRTTHHGYVFEVPATATGLVDPVPLKAMGRFNHEAACVDPETGMVYQTEDRDDGLLYRFIPTVPGKLAEGGKLQALVIEGGVTDSRNWDGLDMARGAKLAVRWIALDAPLAFPAEPIDGRAAAARPSPAPPRAVPQPVAVPMSAPRLAAPRPAAQPVASAPVGPVEKHGMVIYPPSPWQAVLGMWVGIAAIAAWVLGPVALGLGIWTLQLASKGGHGKARPITAIIGGTLGTALGVLFLTIGI